MTILGQAVALFAVTNIDDILILALFFAQGAGHRSTTRNIAAGQYLGFGAILATATAAAVGATFLPASAIPYLGLLPVALGIKSAAQSWGHGSSPSADPPVRRPTAPRVLEVAAVTFANGGDNIGVYVPVFATAGAAAMGFYAGVFLVLVAVWVGAGRYFATRAVVASALGRWGHVVLPVVLVGLGVVILVEGGAFGL